MVDIVGAGQLTTAMSVRLRAVNNAMAGQGNLTSEMSASLVSILSTKFMAGTGDAASEMTAGLTSVFVGTNPKRLIVASPQARPTIL